MPDWTDLLRSRLAGLRVTPTREREIIEELSQHLDERYRELVATGASAEHARRTALEELDEPDALASRMGRLRQANQPPALAPGGPRRSLARDLWQDLRYAARALRRNPGFTAAAVLTLALGIGANSAMFALVDATLLRPLPFPQPDRLVKLWERNSSTDRGLVSPLNLLDWNTRSQSFEVIGAYIPNVGGMVMTGADGTAQTVSRQWVQVGIFDALGIQPVVGRTFSPSDDAQRLRVVVLGEAFWRARFGGDPGIVGQSIRLDGAQYTVVGVVPKEAEIIGRSSIWAALAIQGAPPAARGSYPFHAIGRLKPGVTQEAALSDLRSVATALAREFPRTNEGRDVLLEPMHTSVVGTELRQTAILFLGVVGFVLLICCGNVANLLLTRATARRRELAIRAALGADRLRVARQLLTESLLLSVVGGLVGIVIGALILGAAPSIIPADLLPAGVALTFDARVVGVSALAAIVVGCLFGLAPAWQATSLMAPQSMASDGRTTTGQGGRIRSALVIAEISTAVVLLFGAGLLLRTLLNLEDVDRGYGAESVLTMVVDPLGSRYPTRDALMQFYADVEREVQALPGVRGVAWASTLPLGPSYAGETFFDIVGEASKSGGQRPTADYQIVSADYFETLDLPLVAGRAFTDHDKAGSLPVAIVNEAFVRTQLHGRSPIGARVAIRDSDAADAPSAIREIVGVARQVKGRPDEREDLLQIYVPLAQNTAGDIFMLVTPVSGSADALTSSVRAGIGRVDRDQLVSVRDVMTLSDVARDATSRYRFRAVLVVAFASLALLLAMIGVFGILAYAVQQRLREFGVRRALGATTGDVMRLVAASALRVVGVGTVIGLAISALSSRLLATLLFGVEPLDPPTFASVLVLLALTAGVSVAAPAWRATRVDPVVALRND